MATTEPSGGVGDLLAGAAGSWTLDPTATTIQLRTKALWGLANVKATFRAVEGGGVVTPEGGVSGTLSVDASSVDTRNKRRDTHLRSADFFESDQYPTFIYTATGARPTAADKITVTGTLTVHGETRPLELVATVVQADAGSATLQAEFDVDRGAYGLTWAKLGATKLTNHVEVKARFTKV